MSQGVMAMFVGLKMDEEGWHAEAADCIAV